MKVWIVTAFSAEEYSDRSWVHGVYSSLEKAKESLGSKYQVFDADESGWGGYMLSDRIQEVKVQ